MSDERLLYRPTEAAAMLSISRARLYQLIAHHELGSIKLGASRRIPAAELEAFVERLQSSAHPNERAEPVTIARTNKKTQAPGN
jgi:excisionase family DNA binding protein